MKDGSPHQEDIKTARPTSQSRFSQMAKAALSMIESACKEHRSPLYNRPKATKRMTESYQEDDRSLPREQQKATTKTTERHREDDRKPPCSNKKKSCAMAPTAQHFSLYTFHFSFPTGTTFHFLLFTFHFQRTHFSLSQA